MTHASPDGRHEGDAVHDRARTSPRHADHAADARLEHASTSPTDAPPVERVRLPTNLTDLIQETVRRTRLRRAERRAVEAEFTAHFIDGLACGETVASLHESFGDPRVVARMVRRTVRAKRAPLDRAFSVGVRGAFIGFVALLAIYGALGARLWLSSPTISIDPVERVASLTPKVPGDAAWPLYREAVQKMRERGLWGSGQAPTNAFHPLDPRRRDLETWRTAAATLREHRGELDALRRAASMPRLGYPIGWSMAPEDFGAFGIPATPENLAIMAREESERSAFSIRLPQLALLREAARSLAADATVAAADGDGLRAAESLATIPGMADHAEEAPFFVSQLVASSIISLMADKTIALLEVFPDAFDEQALAALDASIARAPERLRRLDPEFESFGFEDIVQRVYTDDGRGGGRFLPLEWGRLNLNEFGAPRRSEVVVVEALLAPATSIMEPDRAEVLAHQRAYVEALKVAGERPLWEFSFDPIPWFERGPGGVGEPPEVFSVLASSADKAIARRQLDWYRLQAVRAVVALQRFRLAEGHWPETLSELVPRFLPSLPLDPFDGAPLRYRLEDGSPVLWSIGHDRVDDGGVLHARIEATRNAENDAAPGPGTAADALPSMDDRDAASTWQTRDTASEAVAKRDAGVRPAGTSPIHFGDWILFAPGWNWQPESDLQPGTVSHRGSVHR